MEHFNLPKTAKVGRVVPKNAFEKYTNTKQQKLFTDKILRITWTHKLSANTINLDGIDVSEIQLFKIELKEFSTITPLLEIIDKAIPYPIIFWVQHEEYVYLSTSPKHPHPIKEHIAVIDWTFTTNWLKGKAIEQYQLHLRQNLDAIYKDFCLQLAGKTDLKSQSLTVIIEKEEAIHTLKKEIERLKSQIKKSKQFNRKVALNMELQEKEKKLDLLKK